MRRCLREKELVLLHEGEGRPADRDHLEACAGCTARYLRLEDDLRLIGRVLESEPVAVPTPARAAWPRWALAAAVTFALVVGLNVLFARQWGWMARHQAPEMARSGAATTEELIAAVEAMATEEEPPAIEAPAALFERGSSTTEASAAELYATVTGEDGCESLAPLLEDGCSQVPVPGDAWGAGFADLDS